ncbi:glycosyltransferase, partial [bacterium]
MKIAIVGSRGIPAVYGGIERHIEELSSRLVRAGQDVTVYCRDYYTPENCHYYQGVKIRRLPALKTKHLDNIAHTFLSTIDAILAGADIIHYHGIGPALLTLIPVLCGVKTVVTIHSLDWKRKKWGRIAGLFLKTGEFCAALFAHRVIVVSETLKEYFIRKHRRKAFYIPNGINAPLPKTPDLIKDYGLNKDNYILSVGRLVPEKRFEVLIRAFQETVSDKKLVIVGGSGNTDDYMDFLKKIGGHRVLFTGYQNGEILRELYSNAYLFVLPSELEGLPIALLEAMSYGKTALASDIPENREVMGDFGFTFRTNDTKNLAEKLKILLAKNNNDDKESKARSEYIL